MHRSRSSRWKLAAAVAIIAAASAFPHLGAQEATLVPDDLFCYVTAREKTTGEQVLLAADLATGEVDEVIDIGDSVPLLGDDFQFNGLGWDSRRGLLYSGPELLDILYLLDPRAGTVMELGDAGRFEMDGECGVMGENELKGLSYDPIRDVLWGFGQDGAAVDGFVFQFDVDPASPGYGQVLQDAFGPGLDYLPFDGDCEAAPDSHALAVHPGSGAIVVQDGEQGTLLEIDPMTGEILASGVDDCLPGTLRGLEFGSDRMLYASTQSIGLHPNSILLVDPACDEPLDVTPVLDAEPLGYESLQSLVCREPLAPQGLAADAASGNGVLEPGETAELAPTWRNDGLTAQAVTGTAADLSGPGPADYDLVTPEADYATIAPGALGTCAATGSCYEVAISAPAGRPARHWDATIAETLSTGTAKTWTLHLGDSFVDVPSTHAFYPAIETLLHGGVTGGCSGFAYCPGGVNSRAQMPVFVLRALEGTDYVPTACVEGSEEFNDVPFTSSFCRWIEELFHRNVVAGCGGDNYCPSNAVTRAQMAVFLLKTLEGGDYAPPTCTGRFDDVPCPSLFAEWIEDLASREITAGCSPNDYCPGDPVSRAQMAVFVTRTFGLTPYGP